MSSALDRIKASAQEPPKQLTRGQRLLGQAARGPLDLAVVPPALLGLGALGAEKGLGSLGIDADLGSDWFFSEVQRVENINTNLVEDIGEIFGEQNFRVGPPEDWLEQLVNLGTGSLVGGPGSIFAKGGSLPSRVGKGTVEALLPVTQGFSKGRVAANTLVPFAGGELLFEAIEPEQGDQFQSLIDELQGQDDSFKPRPAKTGEQTTKQRTVLDNIREDVEAKEEGISSGALLLGGVGAALAAGLVRRGVARVRSKGTTVESGVPNQERSLDSATTQGEQFVTENQDATFVLANQQKRLVEILREQGTVPNNILLSMEASDFAARMDQSTRIAGEHVFEHFAATGIIPGSKVRTPPLRDWQAEYAGITGNFQRPVQGLSKSAQDAFDSRATDLGSDRRAALDFALFGADSLDQRLFARKASGDPTRTPSLTVFTDADIRIMRTKVLNDPQMIRLVREYNQIGKSMLLFLRDQGAITNADVGKMFNRHSNFMPNELGVVKAPNALAATVQFFDTLFKGTPEAETFQRLPETLRTALHGSRSIETGGGIQNALNPAVAMDIYAREVMRFGMNNKLRTDFVNTLRLTKQQAPNNEFAKSFKEVDRPNENTITITEAGRQTHIEFADPLVKKALEFAPFVAKHQILNGSRRLVQAMTTGPFNPLFAISKTIWWDPQIASIQRPVGRSTSPLDSLVQGATGGRVGARLGVVDPTAVLANLYGAGQDVVSRFNLDVSRRIIADLNNQSGLFSKLPEPVMRNIAGRMRSQYENSFRGILDRYGTFDLGLMADATVNGLRRLKSSEAQIKARLGNTGGSATIKAMRSMIEALHNGSRIRYVAENWRPNMSPKEERQLVQEARNIVGDFTKRGIGAVDTNLKKTSNPAISAARAVYRAGNFVDPTTLLVESVPYYNTVVQAMTRFGKATLAPGIRTEAWTAIALGSTMPMIGGLVLSAQLGDEYLDYYWNARPGWLRATSAYLPIPGLPPEQGIELPIAPEVAAIASTATSGFATTFGFDEQRHVTSPFLNDVAQAGGALFGFMVPPVAQVGANLALDQKIELGFDPTTGEFITSRPVQKEQITGAEVGRNPNSLMSANMEEAIRAMTGTAGAIVLNSLTAGITEEDTKAGLQQLQFEAGKRLGPATGPLGLMGSYTFTVGKQQQLQKIEKIQRIVEIFQKSGLDHGITGRSFPLAIGPDAKQLTPEFIQSAAPIFNAFGLPGTPENKLIEQRTSLSKLRNQHQGSFPHNGLWLVRDRVLAENIRNIDETLLNIVNELEGSVGFDLDNPVFDEPFLQ